MRRAELVNILNQFPNIEVVVEGYEGGTDPIEIDNINMKFVDKAGGEPWCGDYGDPEDIIESMAEPMHVILIGRKH
jgi:hypothetical protein